jgi:hypothetical protein
MPLKALIVMPVLGATWVRELELPFPPYPGLGLRVDVYDVLNVDSVVALDPGYEVTCIVHLEGYPPAKLTEKKIESLGFEMGVYP